VAGDIILVEADERYVGSKLWQEVPEHFVIFAFRCTFRHIFNALSIITGWWFQIFFTFIPTWGRFPF